jgi:NitT/TauT family transport system ATP-binding protein
MSAIELCQRCLASSTPVQTATASQSAELGYRRYEWKCDALNTASRAAAMRFGFRYEGLFRQATVYKGAPLLEVRGVTLQYKTRAHRVTATYRVDFNVLQSDRFVLLGPSGCGKSTLLKAVGGYMRPTEGEILLKGHVVTKSGPVMVFQEFDQLLPWKTVLQNLMFPLSSTRKLGRRLAREKALAYIEKVNLTKFANNYPHTLSGGMKQRAAIARGMAMEPDILLMDEPFAALDALTRVRMQDELLGLWDETKFTVIFVTHSIPEAIKIGNRILLLSPRPGQVKAEINSVRSPRCLLDSSRSS